MPDSLNFDDLTRIEVPVTRGTGEDQKKYVLMEATEAVAKRYMNAMVACNRLTDGKLSGMRDVGDLQGFLVSMCLFQIGEDRGGERALLPVQQGTINGWLSRHVKKMSDKAKEISDLTELGTKKDLLAQRKEIDEQLKKLEENAAEDDEDMTKNEPDDTEDGSG